MKPQITNERDMPASRRRFVNTDYLAERRGRADAVPLPN